MSGILAGKKALVSGAGTGIGREIAIEFAREGADVVLHYAHSSAGAVSAAEEIRALGRRAEVMPANFADVESVQSLGRRAIEFLGGLDCLVNNAGITMNRPFLKVTPEQYNTVFDVNMRAQFFLTQIASEQMIAAGTGGAVVNLTSVHGLTAAPEHAVYAATKGAIIAYTRVLGVELAHKGVRVNAIAPGWIQVENHAKAVPGYSEEKVKAETREKIPVGYAGVPLDIAKLAVFLCSDAARFIIGQTIVADGGTTALMSLISDFRNESTARFGIGYVAGV